MLKLGVNLFQDIFNFNISLGKAWYNNGTIFVIHNFLSLENYNYTYCKFIRGLKCIYNDPFDPDTRLDFFSRYYLCNYLENLEKNLKRKIARYYEQ